MVKINELEDISEDVTALPPLSDIVAMATVAGLAAPVMIAMLKAAYKTGKGINALRKIAKRAGVALSDKVMGEDASDVSDTDFSGQQTLLSNPQFTLVIDTPGELDWSKIGQHFPTLNQQPPEEFGQSESDMMITLSNQEEVDKLTAILTRANVPFKDISGQALHPEVHTEAEQPMAQAPQPQEEIMPIDANAILNFVNDMESKQQFTPEYADQIRNAISSLGAARKTLSPHVLLQLMTMLTQGR